MSVPDRPLLNIAVVRATLSDVVRAFDAYPPMRVRSQGTPFAFPTQSYERDADNLPMLLWSPRCAPGLTAFMPSVASGDYFFVAYCAQFKLEVIDVQSCVRSGEEISQFKVYGHDGKVRVVQALHDSPRWLFFQDGNPLPFEQMDLYQMRRVKDRLTRDAVLSYLEAWGAPVKDPAFWETDHEALTFAPKNSHG